MTDQTGAEQQGAAGSRTGDVDVADESRRTSRTDVQSGGATDLGPGGPDAGTTRTTPRSAARFEATTTDRASVRTRTLRGLRGGRSGVDEEHQKTAEEFAREHDPEKHDVAAGEEFRQEGDWTADDAGGPQVWDSEGHLVEGSTPGEPEAGVRVESASASAVQQDDRSSGSSDDGPRTSSLDEIRDGGYGVGSAAPIDDGAVPLGHPVKAWEDTKTFVTPEHDAYGEAEPHVWFADEHAAQRAGFRPVD